MEVLTNLIVVIILQLYEYQIIALYPLHLYNVISHLYLNRVGEKQIKVHVNKEYTCIIIKS